MKSKTRKDSYYSSDTNASCLRLLRCARLSWMSASSSPTKFQQTSSMEWWMVIRFQQKYFC